GRLLRIHIGGVIRSGVILGGVILGGVVRSGVILGGLVLSGALVLGVVLGDGRIIGSGVLSGLLGAGGHGRHHHQSQNHSNDFFHKFLHMFGQNISGV